MQNVLVNINGRIDVASQAKIEVFDRGFLYGDSLYEVARTHRGVILHLDEHLDRLRRSALLGQMTLGQSLETYANEITRTFEQFKTLPGQAITPAYLRLIVTRGIGRIGFGLNCLTSPTQFVVIAQPLEPPTEAQTAHGLKLKIVDRLRNDARALDPAMKSGNYLNSLLGYLEGTAEGFDDALLCNADGHLTEGTTFNLFYARNGKIATPPLDIGVLEGITRAETIRLARENGIETREVRFPRERLYEADEVFITSTIKEVFPVTQVDDIKINHGKPGRLTMRLRQLYQEHCLPMDRL